MESHKPWLADFIKASLDAWFAELGGCRSAEYQFQKIDDKLKASYRTTCWKTVRLVKLPKLGTTEPRGEISDGIHIIETIFTKGTASEIIGSGAQQGTLLHLPNPILRVTPHVNPPKPLLEITTCKIVDETDRLGQSFSSGCAITEDQDIRERVSKYWVVKRHNRAPSTPVSCGSPDSFKSQVDFGTEAYHGATESDEDADEDLSQRPFCTQVPNGLSGRTVTKPTDLSASRLNGTDTNGREDHFLPLPQDIKRANSSPDRLTPKPTQEPVSKTSPFPRLWESNSPHIETLLPTSRTTGQRSESEPRALSHLANPPLLRLRGTPAVTIDTDTSSPVEISELGANIPVSPTRSADHSHPEPPNLSTKSSPGNRTVVPPSTQGITCQFQRWRKEARAGRYVPRHIQKIPRDQAKLLDSLLLSGDSWQPPLVGRTQRPGEVPLTLLMQLSDVADERANNLASSPKDTGSEVSRQTLFQAQHGRDQEMASAPPSEGNASDSEEPADWSQSPPTQQRRAAKLPPSSPPPDLERQRPPALARDGKDQGGTILSGHDTSLDNLTSQEPVHEVVSLSNDRSPSPFGRGSIQSADPRSSTAEVPQSAQSPHPDPNEMSSSLEDMPSIIAGVSANSSSGKIQVIRTPHTGKGSNLPGLLAARNPSTNPKKRMAAGNPASTFVPGTYDEPSSGEIAAVATVERTVEVLSADEIRNSTTKESDHHSLTVANFQSRECEATKFENDHPGEPLSSVRSANLDMTPFARDNPQRKMEAFPNQQGLGCSDKGDDLSSRPHGPVIAGVRVIEAETSAGAADCRTVAEDNLKAPKTAAGGCGEKATSPFVPKARDAIIIPAKRKRTNSGSSDISMKRQRQVEEVVSIDPDHLPVVEKQLESCEHRRRQVERRKDSIRHPTSPHPVEEDSNSEMPLSSNPASKRWQRSLEAFNRGFDHTQPREERRQHCPEAEASTRHSPLSSSVENDRSSNTRAASQNQGRHSWRPGSTTMAPRRSSTPITRQSSYVGGYHGEVKVMPDESGGADNLFERYTAAYPDYKGKVDDFLNSFCFVKEIWIREPWPKSIHQSHLDDAVFHHYHNYQPYARTAGTAAVGFVEFFHEFVEDPSHHKRIIRPSALEKVPLRRSYLGDILVHQREQTLGSAPVTSTKTTDPLVVKEKTAEQRWKINGFSQAREQAIEDPVDSIERWREDTARTASPELGTPNVDRSLSRRTSPNNESPDPNPNTNTNPDPDPDPDPASEPQRMISIPTTTTPLQKSPEPSASLFVKPQRPVAVDRPESERARSKRSSSVRAKKQTPMRDFWRGTSTAFTMFEQQYAKLTAEKKMRASTGSPGSSQSGPKSNRHSSGRGVDVFAWRR